MTSTVKTRVRRGAPPKRTERLGVGYCRFSTDEQGSTEEQLAINSGIALDEAVTLVEQFCDEGISRDISERPGLLRMFEYLEQHPEIGFIVVNELERLTAGVAQRADVTALCKRLHITIVEDENTIDPRDEAAMQRADERAVQSKAEVIKGRRRTKRNMRAKIVAKTSVALRPPYGIRMKPLILPDGTELPSGASYIDEKGKKVSSGEIELHPDEYPWLLKIFEWAHEGRSSEKIARELNDLGIKSKMGKQFTGNTIGQILENPLYKGAMTWGKRQTLRDEHGNKYQEVRDLDDPGRVTLPSPLGAIVDPAVWDAIEERRRVRKIMRNREPLKNDRHVFDHFVFCGRCGNKMYGRFDNPTSESRTWRYACHGKRPGVAEIEGFVKCTEMNSILEKVLLDALAGVETRLRGKKPQRLGVTVQKGGAGEDLEVQLRRLQAREDTARGKIDNAEDLALDGLISKEKLIATRTSCETELVQVAAERLTLGATPVVEMVPFAGSVSATFAEIVPLLTDEALPVDDRREALVRLGLERVYVDGPSLRLHLRD